MPRRKRGGKRVRRPPSRPPRLNPPARGDVVALEKVTLFILHPLDAPDGARHVLVMDYRGIGDRRDVQLPAGTVDAGETVAVAAPREAYEETGLRLGALHTLDTFTEPTLRRERYLIRDAVLHTETGDIPLHHGQRMYGFKRSGDSASVEFREELPDIARNIHMPHAIHTGTLPADALAGYIRRSLIVATAEGVSDYSERLFKGDHGFTYRLAWRTIDEAKRQLHPKHRRWLIRALERGL